MFGSTNGKDKCLAKPLLSIQMVNNTPPDNFIPRTDNIFLVSSAPPSRHNVVLWWVVEVVQPGPYFRLLVTEVDYFLHLYDEWVCSHPRGFAGQRQHA